MPDSKSKMPDSTSKNFPNSRSQSKDFPDSGIWITLHGVKWGSLLISSSFWWSELIIRMHAQSADQSFPIVSQSLGRLVRLSINQFCQSKFPWESARQCFNVHIRAISRWPGKQILFYSSAHFKCHLWTFQGDVVFQESENASLLVYVSANDEEVERVKVEYNLVNEGSIVDIQVVRHI